jgi:hypothetical protein
MPPPTLHSRIRIIVRPVLFAASAIVISAVCAAPRAEAQTTIGGHMGFVLPLVTHSDGQTTNLGDSFSIAFPVGVTVKGSGRTAFDMEFVSSIQDQPRSVTLTLHPGLVWDVGHRFAVGMRAAFAVNSSEFGFTPLVNKSWPIKTEGGLFKAYFVEADLPVRFDRPTGGPSATPVTFAMHFGVGF